MKKRRRSVWDLLFSGQDALSRRAGIPRWLLPPVRFAYLVIQEFSRNRCPEKASALGFQTVFSLIPAFALALFFFRVFGDFSNLGEQVEPFLYRILKIDKIYLGPPAAAPDSEMEPKPPSAASESAPVAEPRAVAGLPTEPQATRAMAGLTTEPQATPRAVAGLTTEPQATPRAVAGLTTEPQATPRAVAGLTTEPQATPLSPGSEVRQPEKTATGPATPRPSGQPPEALKLDSKIQELVDSVYLKLSTGGLSIVSFAWLVVAALNLALTIEKSLNEIWGSVGQRRLMRRVAVYWSMLTLGPLLIGLSIYAAKQVGVNSTIQELAVSVAGPLFALYLIYQLMPSAPVHPIAAGVGAFVAAVLLQVASWLFGLYLKHAVGYEKLYGNLGLVPLFLFWLWVNWVIVLIGAEVGYTLQNLDRLTAEERRRRGAPFIHPGLVALGLVLHAARAFRTGKGPVDADDLAQSSGLPDKLWIRLVDLLRERGILVETGPDGSRFIPGRPLEALSVEEIFAAVDDSLVARFDEIWHPEQEHLQALANLLARARQRELGATSIADLLDLARTQSGGASETSAGVTSS